MQKSFIGMGVQDTGAGKVLPNTIFKGDNLFVLRGLESETIDLIATDPPFNSKRIFNAPIGSDSEGAQFKDRWTFDDVDRIWMEDSLPSQYPAIYYLIESMVTMGDESLASFIIYMTQRVIEMHRILKPTGSLYLHCDQTAGHYLKIMLDCIFGVENFRNDIIWCYTQAVHSKNWFGKKHDNILFYSKGKKYTFNCDAVREPMKEASFKDTYKYIDKDGNHYGLVYKKTFHRANKNDEGSPEVKRIYPNALGSLRKDWIDIPYLGSTSKERVGYPTQKPSSLYEIFIKASSNEGELVLDPFCGCATTCITAHKLLRNWIGIDVSEKAYDLVAERLEREIGFDAAEVIKMIHYRTDTPKRVNDVVWTPKPELKRRLYGEQEGLCNHCRQNFPIEVFDIDHIVPTSKGGHDGDDNKQLLCRNCNSTKGNKADETAKVIMQTRMQKLRGLPRGHAYRDIE